MAKASRNHTPDFVANPQADKADNCPHPREVYTLIGHQKAERHFATLLDKKTLHHAWLISGASGIGKATLAYRMVRRVLGGQALTPGCLDVPEHDPVAQRVQSLGHGDFLLIRRPYDEKTKKLRSGIPVSETRKMRDFFSRKASEGGWRVCLIDSIDEMNRNSANAVLKTLEEPPDKALIILLSKAPGNLLPTIRSRCMNMQLRPVDKPILATWLAGKTNVDDADIKDAVQLSKGAPGKAYALAQNADMVLRPLRNFMESFPKTSPHTAHIISDLLAVQKANISYGLFQDSLLDILYAQAIYASTGEWESAFHPIALERQPEEWLNLHTALKNQFAAQAGLNMNKKTVLLQSLLQVGD